MEKTTKLDEKILKLKQKRSKIDVEGLKSEKEKYTNMLTDYLDKTSEEHPEKEWKRIFSVISKINDKLKKALVLDEKIKDLEEIKEKINSLPLRKDTEEWIAEILEVDPVYQLAKEKWDEEILKKFQNRTLRLDEYTELQSNLIKKETKENNSEWKSIKNKVINEEEIWNNQEWQNEQWWEKFTTEWDMSENEVQDLEDENNNEEENDETEEWENIENDEYTKEQLKKIDRTESISWLNILLQEYNEFWIDNIEIATSLFDKIINLINEYLELYYDDNPNWNYEYIESYNAVNTHDFTVNEITPDEPQQELLNKFIENLEFFVDLILKSDIENKEIVDLLLSYETKETDLNIQNSEIIEFENSCNEIIENGLTTIILREDLNEKFIWKIYNSKYKKSIISWVDNIVNWKQRLNDDDAKILFELWCWRSIISNIQCFDLTEDWLRELTQDIKDTLYPRYNYHKDEEFTKVKTLQWLKSLVDRIIKGRTKRIENLINRSKRQWKQIKKSENINIKSTEETKESRENEDTISITPKILYNIYQSIIDWDETDLLNLKDEDFWSSIQSVLKENINKNTSSLKKDIEITSEEETHFLLELILSLKENFIENNENKDEIIDLLLSDFENFKKFTVPFDIDDEVLKLILAYWKYYLENPWNPNNEKEHISIYNWEDLLLTPEIKTIKDRIDELEIEKRRIEEKKIELGRKAYKEYPKTSKEIWIEESMNHVEYWSDNYMNYEKQLNNLNIKKERNKYIEDNILKLNEEIEWINLELRALEERYVRRLKATYPERVYNLIIEYKKQKNK